MNNSELSLAERETHISQCADNRSKWEIYTDDSVMMTRLNKIAKGVPHGAGMKYTLDGNQVSFRRKRKITDVERARLSEQAKANFHADTSL